MAAGPNDYVVLADLKTYRGATTTVNDVGLQLAITAASSAIDRACNRGPSGFGPKASTVLSTTLNGGTAVGATSFTLTSVVGLAVGAYVQLDVNSFTTTLGEVRYVETLVGSVVGCPTYPLTVAHLTGVAAKTVKPRFYTAARVPMHDNFPWEWNPFFASWRAWTPRVEVDDLFDLTSVVAYDRLTGVPMGIDRGSPWNAALDLTALKPYTALEFTSGTVLPILEGQIGVAANFGWPSIPVTIQNACLLQASRYFERHLAPFGIAGDIAQGSGMRLFSELDPDVAMMLGDYTRRWAAV